MKKILSALGFVVIIIAAAIGAGVGKDVGKNLLAPVAPTKQKLDEALIKGFNKAAEEANSKGPIMVDSDTSWDNTTVGPGVRINYFYSLINYSSKDIDKTTLINSMQPEVTKNVCSSSEMKVSLELGATYSFVYKSNDGVEIGRIEVNSSKCP